MALSQTSVLKVYTTVIDDVIAGVRDAFLDDGVDEQVLQEMKQVWTSKLMSCKAIEAAPDPQDQQAPSILSHSTKSNGTKKSKAAAAAAAASASAANNQQENGKANANSGAANNTKVTPATNVDPLADTVVPSGGGGAATAGSNASNATQQTINQSHQQNAAAGNNVAGNATAPSAPSSGGQQQQQQSQQSASAPAAVVAALDPNKLVAIQITLPAQPNVANSQPRVLTIQVPASALQENQLQQVLTSPIISSIMPLPPHIASTVLQQHVNSYLQNSSINSLSIQKQLDGACDDDPSVDEREIKANYTLVEVSSTANRFLLDQQLLSALAVGQRSSTGSDDTITSTCASSSGQSMAAKKIRRRPLRVSRKSLKKAKDEAVSIEICTSMQLDGAVDTSDEEASDISDDNIPDDDDEDLDKEEEDDLEAEGGAEEEPLNSEDDVTDEDASDLFDTDNVVVCQYDKITRSRNKWKFYLKDGIMHISGKDYVFQKSNGDAEW
ncbi:transcription initiation factor IIA subunit 1 isoform X2 [Anopheles ziemanni]|uniref:transcription initiation factor IIA subunit 1 isoform X2 n=1 Tax=Anopheles coustani TaxID=139045 RepID=UPI0026585AB5|nr:transcription initiation factor IIA subunit 1 isoform X2 [Anopheles coustani]XP_058174707.1 transcription initiation factor IIA subunit 1 isoform X2 [Anopheles ziemanni]